MFIIHLSDRHNWSTNIVTSISTSTVRQFIYIYLNNGVFSEQLSRSRLIVYLLIDI